MSSSTSTPNNTYDIDRYRRAKKRKKIFNRTLLVVLVLIVLGFLYCIAETIIQTAEAEKSMEGKFPVSLTGEDPTDFLTVNNGLMIVGDDKLLGYSSSAKKQADLVHNMSKPVAAAVGERVLAYDCEGYSWQVSRGNEVLFSQTVENQIILGRMHSSGTLAIVTFADRFYGSVTVYSSDFQQIYKYSESQNYLTGFEFLDKRKGLLISQTVSGLSIDTVLTGLDFTKDEDTKLFTTTLEGTVVYRAMVQKNGSALLVTDQGILLMKADGSVTTTETFESDLRFVSTEGTSLVVAAADPADVNWTLLSVIGSDGKIAAQTTVHSIVQDLYCDSTGVVYLDRDHVVTLDYTLAETGVYTNAGSYIQVVRYRGNLYGMSTEAICLVQEKAEDSPLEGTPAGEEPALAEESAPETTSTSQEKPELEEDSTGEESQIAKEDSSAEDAEDKTET